MSLVVQTYFVFENSSFVVHFDQTRVLFWITRYVETRLKMEIVVSYWCEPALLVARALQSIR